MEMGLLTCVSVFGKISVISAIQVPVFDGN
jgi:hypothetical protein